MTDERINTNLDQLFVHALCWMDEGLLESIRKRGGPPITHSQSLIIMAIGEGVTRPSAIAERLGVSRQALHQTLRELINAKLVALVPDPGDGRAKLARLSKSGAPLQRMVMEIMGELEVNLAARIGKRRFNHLRTALEQEWGDPVILD